MTFVLPRLQKALRLVDKDGTPALTFLRWFNMDFAGSIERQEAVQGELIAGLAEAVEDIQEAMAAAQVADDKAEAAQEDADTALVDAANAQTDADTATTLAMDASDDAAQAQLTADELADGTRSFTNIKVNGLLVTNFLEATDGSVIVDPAAIPSVVIESQVRGSVSNGTGLSYNSGTGEFSLNLNSGLVTGALGFTPLDAAEKGATNGVVPLSGGKIASAYLPPLAITDVFVVASQAAQLALTAEEGDVAVRTDLTKSYIHNGGTAGTMADWQELLTPPGAVLSVNAQTGAVVLSTSDITEGSNLYYTNGRADARIAAAAGVTVADYAAGTFTPVLKFGGATTGITYGQQTGRWTKTGRLYTCEVAIVLSAGGSATGSATITGLPASATMIIPGSVMIVGGSGVSSPVVYVVGSALVLVNQTATGLTALSNSNIGLNTEIYLTITYSV